jgi:hypothetical protein
LLSVAGSHSYVWNRLVSLILSSFTQDHSIGSNVAASKTATTRQWHWRVIGVGCDQSPVA